MAENEKLITCCGIDCSVCDVRRGPDDPELAKKIADWINERFDDKCTPDMIKCTWCRGEKESHWNPDCWILQCCVDKNDFEYCSDCNEFPCSKLVEWSKGNEKYTKAFERLKEMKCNDIDNRQTEGS